MSLIERCSCGKTLDDCEQRMLALVQERDTWKRRCVEDTARLREVVRRERNNLRGAVASLAAAEDALARAANWITDPARHAQISAARDKALADLDNLGGQ
jgi:hypothetical protein